MATVQISCMFTDPVVGSDGLLFEGELTGPLQMAPFRRKTFESKTHGCGTRQESTSNLRPVFLRLRCGTCATTATCLKRSKATRTKFTGAAGRPTAASWPRPASERAFSSGTWSTTSWPALLTATSTTLARASSRPTAPSWPRPRGIRVSFSGIRIPVRRRLHCLLFLFFK